MNLVLLRSDELRADNRADVRGTQARHILEVHRAAVGDTVRVGVVGGLIGEGVVTSVAPDLVTLDVRVTDQPPAPLAVDVLLAMPRPKMLRRILAAAASMGVKRIVLINSARVEKSYFDSPLVSPASIEDALMDGLAQARDTILPSVRIAPLFRPFVEDELDAAWPAPGRRLLAHPAASRGLHEFPPVHARESTVLAIGPEGGWVPFEVALLEARGFQTFSAGPRTLRVDTAVAYLLGQLASRACAIGGSPGS